MAELVRKGLSGLSRGSNQSSLQPPRTYQCAENFVYHLARDPSYSKKTIVAPDIPFDIEEGDHVWATGLIPEAQYIQASSTISQWLAEGPHPRRR